MSNLPETGYVTKYALSTGIYKTNLRPQQNYETAEDVTKYRFSTPPWNPLRVGKDLFYTEEEAIEDAKRRAKRRLESLKKERKKLKLLAKEPKWDLEVPEK